MLSIILEGTEFFDEETETFSTSPSATIDFEHSLVSLSKWESKHQISFLSNTEKSSEQLLDYLKCMIVNKADPNLIYFLNEKQMEEIQNYINSAQSATTFKDLPGNGRSNEQITSELIYYWMVAFSVPFSCETWHLNRLLSLIKICNIKNSKPKKMSRMEMARQNRELNAKRRAEYGTKG